MDKIAPSEEKRQQLANLREKLMGDDSMDAAKWLSELVRVSTEYTIQQLLESEQASVLHRDRYERGEQNACYRNGYEPGKLRTAEGVLSVKKPQIRGLAQPYRSKLWSRLQSNSEVLEAMVTELYARGLSVRDIEETLLQATGAFVISDTAVSEVTKRLTAEYEAFVNRDLSEFDLVYLFVDAVYEPLRRYGAKAAVLCAWGILSDGSRVLLHMERANSESFEACKAFFENMIRRGLRTPMTITSDGSVGLCKAIEQVYPRSLRIRCWFHKMQNLQSKVPPAAWPEFKQMVMLIRDAGTVKAAENQVEELCKRYRHEFPSACDCLQDDLEASLNHLRVPLRHQQLVRTTNLIERSFEEQRRRTKVIPHLFSEPALIRLVFAVLSRVEQRWRRRLFSDFEQRQIIALRDLLLDQQNTNQNNQPTKQQRRTATRAAH
jgi:putative transposase